jgi:hypothetical protein
MPVACAPSSPQHIRSERATLPSSPRAAGYQQASVGTIAHLAEFIALDRLCCPFIRHGLFVEPDTGSSGRATSRGQTHAAARVILDCDFRSPRSGLRGRRTQKR